jgi:hypothetical protein
MSVSDLFGGGPILTFPPTSTAEPGEVLTVGSAGELVWAAVTAEGTVTGTTNQINVQSAGGNVTVALDPGFVNVPGALGYNATNNQSMQFPTQRGTAGQVLASDGAGMINWVNQTGGGSSVEGTTNQIKATTVSGTTTLSFDTATVIPGALTINGATAPMAFPTTNGGAGQLLSTNGSGQLTWVSETTSGTVSGTAGQIDVATSGGTSTISLDPALVIPGSIKIGNYNMPTTAGASGTVLTSAGANQQLTWAAQSSSGSITGTTGQIDVTTTGGNSVISLDSNLALPGSLTIGSGASSYTFPTTRGTAGQVLETNASGIVTWQTASGSSGVTQLTTSDANVSLSASTGAIALNMANPPTYGPASEKYELPTSLVSPVVGTDYSLKVSSVVNGTAVLTFDAGTAGGITAVNGTANQITATPSGSTVTLSLPNQISLIQTGASFEITEPSGGSQMGLSASSIQVRDTLSNVGASLSGTSGVTVYTQSGSTYKLPTNDPVVNQVLTAGASGQCTWTSPGAASAITGTASPTLYIGQQSSSALPCVFNALTTLKTLKIDFSGIGSLQFQDSSAAFAFNTDFVPYPAGCASTLANQVQTLGTVYCYTYSANPGSQFVAAGFAWVMLEDQNQTNFCLHVNLNQNDIRSMFEVQPTQLFNINHTNAGNVPNISTTQSFVYI